MTDAPSVCLSAPRHTSEIQFAGVEFGYDRQKGMLRIPSLRIAAGEKLAISGENGAGKSTMAKLIARIYDVDSGSVRIGVEDVRNIGLDSLRRHVCYVPREPVLFDGSVAFNLRFVKPAVSIQELETAMENAGLSEVVESLPQGLDQKVGPGACQLSGGERQRLAIARALLQRPHILILDEATSCLDPNSEESVLRNVCQYLEDSTVIVVSHRHSTVTSFPRRIVMASGEIVGDWQADTIQSPRSSLTFPSQMPATAD